EIAEAMAAAIRGNLSLSSYTASAKGANLLIVKNSAAAFGAAPALSVTPAASLGTPAAAAAFLVDLSGTLVNGDRWTVSTQATPAGAIVNYSVTIDASLTSL